MDSPFAVGGHKDSILFEGGSVLKKFQDKGRGEREVEFLRTAAAHPELSSFVPRYIGCRNGGKRKAVDDSESPTWIEMEDILAGMMKPMVM